jgi:hypothetical protein
LWFCTFLTMMVISIAVFNNGELFTFGVFFRLKKAVSVATFF